MLKNIIALAVIAAFGTAAYAQGQAAAPATPAKPAEAVKAVATPATPATPAAPAAPVAKALRLLPNALYDRLFANAPHKPKVL